MNTPGGNTAAAAELTMAHILGLSRNIPQACLAMKVPHSWACVLGISVGHQCRCCGWGLHVAGPGAENFAQDPAYRPVATPLRGGRFFMLVP